MSVATIDIRKMDKTMLNLFLSRTAKEIFRIRAERPDVWAEVQRRAAEIEAAAKQQQKAPD